MSENEEVKQKKQKTKVRGRKRRLAGRFIALLMVIMMLLATCSSLIFYLIYNAK